VAIRPNISDQVITNIMLKTTLLASLSAAAVASAELLDIPGLLASLAPAPEGDSRFNTFTPPGHNDG
jgi:hypothetical protein